MKSLEEIISYDALYESMLKCRNNVMWKDSVRGFYLDAPRRLRKLSKELKERTYVPRPPKIFEVFSAKKRTILGISFRDRVYQRSLNDNMVYPCLCKHLIYDNVACQKNKGTDFGRDRLHCHLQREYRKSGLDGYILQCDILNYYGSMSHENVKLMFQKYIPDDIYPLVEEIIDTQYCGDGGFYPGSQLIQLVGITYLNELDHFIKEKLHIKGYIRYMDDFILIHEDKEYLEYCQKEITKELEKIGLQLHPRKTHIVSIKDKIKFLGFSHQLKEGGGVDMLILSKSVKNERRRLRKLVHLHKVGRMSEDKLYECYNCWRHFANKGNSRKVVNKMDKFLSGLLSNS